MQSALFRAVYLPLTALALAWGLLAFWSTQDLARAGYSLSRGQLVVHVVPGSPAEGAGLRAGDSIIRIDGAETNDRAAVARLSRGLIGDVRRLDIQRDDKTLVLDLELAGLTPRERWRRYAGIFTGMCFLGITGLAWARRPTFASAALAVMGLGLGLAFMGPASPGAETWRLAAALLRNALILTGVGGGLHFLRLMVARHGKLRSHAAAIYVPLAAFWLLLAVRSLAGNETPMLVRSFISVTGGLLFGLYLMLAIVTLATAWVRGRQSAGVDRSLRLLCLGPALGLAPVAAAALIPVLLPAVALPAVEFWFLAILLVPLCWSAAAVTYKD